MHEIKRMWVNQPSINQTYHPLHGSRVLAVPEDVSICQIFFLSGSAVSQQIPISALSEGWPASQSEIPKTFTPDSLSQPEKSTKSSPNIPLFGEQWETWRRENIPNEIGYIYQKALHAFHAGWSSAMKYQSSLTLSQPVKQPNLYNTDHVGIDWIHQEDCSVCAAKKAPPVKHRKDCNYHTEVVWHSYVCTCGADSQKPTAVQQRGDTLLEVAMRFYKGAASMNEVKSAISELVRAVKDVQRNPLAQTGPCPV